MAAATASTAWTPSIRSMPTRATIRSRTWKRICRCASRATNCATRRRRPANGAAASGSIREFEFLRRRRIFDRGRGPQIPAVGIRRRRGRLHRAAGAADRAGAAPPRWCPRSPITRSKPATGLPPTARAAAATARPAQRDPQAVLRRRARRLSQRRHGGEGLRRLHRQWRGRLVADRGCAKVQGVVVRAESLDREMRTRLERADPHLGMPRCPAIAGRASAAALRRAFRLGLRAAAPLAQERLDFGRQRGRLRGQFSGALQYFGDRQTPSAARKIWTRAAGEFDRVTIPSPQRKV